MEGSRQVAQPIDNNPLHDLADEAVRWVESLAFRQLIHGRAADRLQQSLNKCLPQIAKDALDSMWSTKKACKSLGQCQAFNGDRKEGIFFVEASGAERAVVGANYGAAHANKRLYQIEVLHKRFPDDAPLRGTHAHTHTHTRTAHIS